MANELKEIIEGIGESFDEFKKTNDGKIDGIVDRIEKIESLSDRPSKSSDGGRGKYSRDELEHRDTFLDWVRNPNDGAKKRRLDDAQDEMISKKAVTIGSDVGGGYALPALIADQVESRVTTLNPFRRICRVLRVGSSDFAHLVSKNQAGSGWVGEGDTRTETATSDLVERKPTFGTVYAYPKSSEEAFADIFFDVQAWLVSEISDAFAAAEAIAFVSGDGSNKPTGFLNSNPVTTGDTASPERGAAELQYLPMSSTSPQAVHGDDLIELANSLRDGYLMDESSVAWVMRRATLTNVRKLKDTTGQYLWQPSLQAGEPSTLLGFPVLTTDAMQAYVADAHPIAFGNWNRGYLIADRSEIRLTVDDNISEPGQVKFYARKRVGGCVLNNETLKLLKLADT